MKVTWLDDYPEADNASPPPKIQVAYRPKWPVLIRVLYFMRQTNDTGVGDTVERIFAKFGGTQFKWLMDRLGVNCGCEDRKQYLNRIFPYAPKLHHEETN